MRKINNRSYFSLHEIAKPKFVDGQICVDNIKPHTCLGLLRPLKELIVSRDGKVKQTEN